MWLRKTKTKIPMTLSSGLCRGNLTLKSTKTMLIWRTGLVAETGKMVNHKLLLSNLPTMPSKIRKNYSNKKKLKRKKFLVTESLTSWRYNLLKEVQEKYNVKNVWPSDGHILFEKKQQNFNLQKLLVLAWWWNIIAKYLIKNC